LSEDDQTSILKVLVQLRDEATEPLKKVSESFEAFSDSLHGIWYSALEIGAGYEMLKGIIEPASAFEDAQVGLRMVTNDSAEALKQFQEQAEELSIKFPKSAEDITTAQENMYKKLGDVGATLKATEIATQLATALRVDATTGSNILGSAFENLKIKGKDTNESLEKLSDNLALLRAGFLKSDAPVGNMERDLRQLGQVAGKTHVDVDQLFTVWAELSKLGQGGRAGAAIVVKGIIDKLTESNKNGTNELARYGLHIQRTKEKHLDLIATLQQIANLPSAQRSALVNQMKGQNDALGLLVQNMGDMNTTLARFNADAGESAKDAKKVNELTSSGWKELADSATNLRVALGAGLKPQIDGISDALKGTAVGITEFSKLHPTLTGIIGDLTLASAGLVTLAGIVGAGKMIAPFIALASRITGITALFGMMQTAIFGITAAIGGAATAGEAMSLVFAANPLGWVVVALAGLVAIAEALYHIKDIEEAMGLHPGAHMNPTLPVHPFDKQHFDPRFAASPAEIFSAHMAEPSDISHQIREVETHLHYMEGATVSVQVGAGVDGQQVGSAVRGALDQHSDNLMRFLHDIQHDDARRSFGNPSLEGAR
jgi:TP901 family phage tail tape measure protein